MGRWGLAELAGARPSVVGLMSHLATADSDPVVHRGQLERFLAATDPYAAPDPAPRQQRGGAALPETRLDAARCGIALYGIVPFGRDAGRRPPTRAALGVGARAGASGSRRASHRLRKAVRGDRADLDRDRAGRLRGRFPARPARGPTSWSKGSRVPVVGTISMDALAVRLPEPAERGCPVTLVGDGVPLEDARARRGDDRLRARVWHPDRTREGRRGRSSSDRRVEHRRALQAERHAELGGPGPDRCSRRSAVTSVRSTSAAVPARSPSRSRRSSARSSASTRPRSTSRPPARARRRTARSCRATRRRCRSRTGTSISSAACACSTTSSGRSSSSSELARVTRPGGRILLADQLGDVDPIAEPRDSTASSRHATVAHAAAPRRGHPRLPRRQRPRGAFERDRQGTARHRARTSTWSGSRARSASGSRGWPRAVYEVEIGWYVAVKV